MKEWTPEMLRGWMRHDPPEARDLVNRLIAKAELAEHLARAIQRGESRFALAMRAKEIERL